MDMALLHGGGTSTNEGVVEFTKGAKLDSAPPSKRKRKQKAAGGDEGNSSLVVDTISAVRNSSVMSPKSSASSSSANAAYASIESTEAPALLTDLLSVHSACHAAAAATSANSNISNREMEGHPSFEESSMIMFAFEAQVAARLCAHAAANDNDSSENSNEKMKGGILGTDLKDVGSVAARYLRLCETLLGGSTGPSSSSSSNSSGGNKGDGRSGGLYISGKAAAVKSNSSSLLGGGGVEAVVASMARIALLSSRKSKLPSVFTCVSASVSSSSSSSSSSSENGSNQFVVLARRALFLCIKDAIPAYARAISATGGVWEAGLDARRSLSPSELQPLRSDASILERWLLRGDSLAVALFLASFPLYSQHSNSGRSSSSDTSTTPQLGSTLLGGAEMTTLITTATSKMAGKAAGTQALLVSLVIGTLKHLRGVLSTLVCTDSSSSKSGCDADEYEAFGALLGEAMTILGFICKSTSVGELSPAVSDCAAHAASMAITLVTHTLRESYLSLKRCNSACVALKELLKPFWASNPFVQEPSARVSLVRLLHLGAVWRDQEGKSASGSSLHASAPSPTSQATSIPLCAVLSVSLGAQLSKLFLVLRPHLDHATELHCDFGGSVRAANDNADDVAPNSSLSCIVNPTTSSLVLTEEIDVDTFSKVDALHEMSKRLDEATHIEALAQMRAFVSIASMCCTEDQDVPPPASRTVSGSRKEGTGSSHHEKMAVVADEIDLLCEKVSRRTLFSNHTKSSRVVRLQTACMVGSSYSRGLVGEYSVQDNSGGMGEEGMFDGAVEPAGRFSCYLAASQTASQLGAAAHNSSRSGQYEFDAADDEEERLRQEHEKESPNLISISSFARFCQHTAVTNPVAAVWALRHIVMSWVGPVSGGADGITYRAKVALEELGELARLQILRYLMVSNVALTVEHIIVPLLLRSSEDENGSYMASNVLCTLCSRLVAYKGVGSALDDAHGEAVIQDEIGFTSDFIDYANGQIISGIVTARDVEAVRCAKKKLRENQDSFGSLAYMTDLVDSQATVLYHLLVSSRVQQMDEKDLVKKSFEAFLRDCCGKLEVDLEGPSTAPTQQMEDTNGRTPQPLKPSTIQRTLLPLIWDLGAKDATRREYSMKALRVFCTLVLAGQLSLTAAAAATQGAGDGSRGGRGPSRGGSSGRGGGSTGPVVSDKLSDNVSSVLPDHFLYIMSRLIQQQTPTLNQKVQSMYCLREIVCLLRQPDLAKFLPKIISSMDSVLSSSSGKVRLAGVELTAVLCTRLQIDVLCENLSSLVVALYPSLESVSSTDDGGASGAISGSAVSAGSGQSTGLEPMHDLNRLGEVPSKPESDSGLYDDNYIPSLYAEDLTSGMSCDMLCIYETAYDRDVNAKAEIQAKAAAISILHSLFVRRRNDLGDSIQTIAVIPALKELAHVRKVHEQAMKGLTHEQLIALLIRMLHHESAHVRCLGLNRLLIVISEKKKEIYKVLSRANASAGSTQFLDTENFVTLILKDLLLLAAKENEERVLLSCAACLGELGAIDPARVNIMLPTATKKAAARSGSRNRSGGSNRASSSTSEELGELNMAPWELSPTEMGFVLLENHLVPSLKGLAHMVVSDKTGFAIQTTLHLIAEFEVPEMDHSKGAKVALPVRLREMLADRSILDVAEPFWYTRYRIQGQPPPRKTPIYYPGNSFNYWCAAWVRMLISHSSGVSSHLFDTCKAIYRHRSELSQFVLPHVMVNYLVYKSKLVVKERDGSSSKTELESDFDDVKWEICCVLRGVGDITAFQSIEDMIPPLEEFNKCIATVEGDDGAAAAAQTPGGYVSTRNSSSSNGNGNGSNGNDKRGSGRSKHTISSSSGGGAAPTTGGASSASSSGSGGDHMHIQAVFTLLDSLTRWTARGLRKRNGKEKDKHAQEKREDGSVIPQTTLLSALMEDVRNGRPDGGSKAPLNRQKVSQPESVQLSLVVRSLIDAIPLKLLAFAALRIKAYARAIRYFELHLRMSDRDQANQRSKDSHVDVSRLYDGSNYSLPKLKGPELDLLMTIYSKLEDPDSIQGVQMLRQHAGLSLSPWHRILELEQTDNWLGALLEYGLVNDGDMVDTSSSSAEYPMMLATGATTGGAGADGNNHKKRRRNSFRGDSNNSMDVDDEQDNEQQHGGTRAAAAAAVQAAAVLGGGADTLHARAQVDRGRLRCLIELGHLDAAADLSQGVAHRLPELEMAMLPLGVEASWRLNRWDSLDELLSRTESAQHLPTDSVGMLTDTASTRLGALSPAPVALWTPARSRSRSICHQQTPYSSGGFTDDRESHYVVPMLPEDAFSVNLGRLFKHMSVNDFPAFARDLDRSRLNTMASLSAASMESYGRAYPLLTQLHVLSEMESGYKLVNEATKSDETSSGNARKLLEDWRWGDRIKFMAPSERQRSLSMAVRRSLFGLAELPDQVEANWLHASKSMRLLGQFDAARIALRNAEQHGLRAEDALLEECRILKGSGQIHRALTMLEPVEIDLLSSDLKGIVREYNSAVSSSGSSTRGTSKQQRELQAAIKNAESKLPAYLASKLQRFRFAERLLLATQLMVDSKVKHGSAIMERFKLVTELKQEWDLAHFEFARYNEDLYHDARAKEIAADKNALVLPASRPRGGNSRSGSSVSSMASGPGIDEVPRSFIYCIEAVNQYNKCIKVSDDSALTLRALPRMLTLWFSFTVLSVQDVFGTNASAALQPSGNNAGASHHSRDSFGSTAKDPIAVAQAGMLDSAQNEMQKKVKRWTNNTAPTVWFQCLPQLVSRIGHPSFETKEIIKDLLRRVLTAYPQQSIWHLACLLQSLIADCRKAGEELIRRATRELESTRAGDATMLRQSREFFTNLIELAAYQHAERRMQWKWSKEVDFRRFIVPLQGVLSTAISPSSSASGGPGAAGAGGLPSAALDDFADQTMQISHLEDLVDVATSKAKPKTIYVKTTCGKTIKFLCKQEKNGDLRKDNRMMEFNHTVNRVLQESADGRRRNLRLRTFAVVCLNEECGILEWVNNTSCIRHLITEAHQQYPLDSNFIGGKSFFDEVMAFQEENKYDLENLKMRYHEVVLDRYKPCFHRWFLAAFPDPTAWLDTRATFTRSCAVWSAVGHVVGLGDRHTENILLDTTNGECVHVDFDCLFDKGLSLLRPEIVPFRLTPNMVDAMGLTGVEGTFRRTMEVTMGLLRDNKDTLLSVLEPFLRDPTVAWSRSGRAQRPTTDGASTTSKLPGGAGLTENADAKEALSKISGRLSGVYNLGHPNYKKILAAYHKRGAPLPQRGLGAQVDEYLPLSVQGQVARMIDEARSEENLAQMYIGWQPWA
jgi:serine/threonine-protein kinase ATR